jgi:uncharacterized phage infection (PIP) family protein YhgE
MPEGKGYKPISTVKPKSKVKRKIHELTKGSKAYTPASPALAREQKSLGSAARRLRKKQSEVYGSSKPKKKDRYDKPSYGDKLILGGLKAYSSVKKDVKRGVGLAKKDLKKVAGKITRKKKKASSETGRTKVISGSLGKAGVEKKTIRRMKGK